MVCNSCGGVLGRDCFNPVECAWITQQIYHQDQYVAEQLQHQLMQANQAILTLQLANESLQHEVELLKGGSENA